LDVNKEKCPNRYRAKGEQANVSLDNDGDDDNELVMCGICVTTKDDYIELEEQTLDEVSLTDEYADVIVSDKTKF
jgi:formylmethanofuran dehydrogenase subunit D